MFEAVESYEQRVVQPPAPATTVDGSSISGRSLRSKLDTPSAKDG